MCLFRPTVDCSYSVYNPTTSNTVCKENTVPRTQEEAVAFCASLPGPMQLAVIPTQQEFDYLHDRMR